MRVESRFSIHASTRSRFQAVWLLAFAAIAARAQIAPIGLSSVRAQAFANQEIDGFLVEVGDRFGWSFAAGDFNGDGVQDLATGMPHDNGPADLPLVDAGIVHVRWGVPGTGLVTNPAPTLLSLYTAGGQTHAHAFDEFGFALAAGDFNGDGRDDLAVGIPGFDTGDGDDFERGAVQVHYGLPGGIQEAGEHLFYSGPNANIPDPPEQGNFLGRSLATGDFDGDGFDDLAIGAPQHVFNFGPTAGGAVVVLHGGVGGLMPVAGYLIHQDHPSVPDGSEDPDDFGWALAAGNFNGDLRCDIDGICRPIDDLAMSAPGEDGVGAVMVMLGSVNKLIFANSIYIGQGDLGGLGEADDRFGSSLAAGNFNGDCCDDLAIGTPFENLGVNNANADAGEITIVYGHPTLLFVGAENLTQGGIFGSSVYDQAGDQFGFALAAGDFDRDGYEDLAIGQPGEDVGGSDRGGATILMGGLGGLYERFRFLAAGINGIPPGIQNASDMGRALGAGDFDGNGYSDLAIGLPFRDVGGLGDVGMETILYGAMFADGFESGNDWYWTESEP